MKNLFISHSSKDQELAQGLVKLLRDGAGLSREQIFCTSVPGTLAAGSEFLEVIRREIRQEGVVIPLLSKNYLQSKICLMELGAAWTLDGENGKKLIPMMADDIGIQDLADTPLRNVQIYRILSGEGLAALYDEMIRQGFWETMNTAEFNRAAREFLDSQKNAGNRLLERGADGYYTAKIVQVRKVPANYRCYQIQGLVKDALDGEPVKGESHWLFYFAGMYPDLAPGDLVRFKYRRTELRDFPNLPNARNIYPTMLEKV